MNDRKYEYEVAFSFVKEDEELAIQINELLRDRLSTFIYSKKQKVVAGTDGEITFSNVFSKQSRIVIVLYRKEWGSTSWTRIEETAIRNRAFDEGYNFVLFIPLDQNKSVPQYLPKTQIWIGLDRWGIEGVASVIEARVQSIGGQVKEETLADIAARMKREKEFETKRSMLLQSTDGVTSASLEFNKLLAEIENQKNILVENDPTFPIGYNIKDYECYVNFGGLSIRLRWMCLYSNSLLDSKLIFELQEPKRIGDPYIYQEYNYHFDMNKSGEYGWIKETKSNTFKSSQKLVEELFKILFKQAELKKERENSGKYI